MDLELNRFLFIQSRFVQLKEFKNVFETMRELLSNIDWDIHRNTFINWLLSKHISNNFLRNVTEDRSDKLRALGNELYSSKTEDKQNILRACQLYTEAIFAASAESASLPLAHANRAIALQEFGYHQEAYDDCECARALDYPKEKMAKILLRQAHCCWKMEDPTRLELHLDELEKHTLNERIMQQVKALQAGLIKLKMQDMKKVTERNEYTVHKEAQTIVESCAPSGNHMIASKPIKAGEIIFVDRATSFIPLHSNRNQICQQCAKTLFIPFPCYHCHGEVVYCSLNCRIKHEATHVYECFGWQQKLFEKIGGAYLALRIVLDELPKVIPLLRHKRNAEEIWTEFTSCKSILKNYKKIFRLSQPDTLNYHKEITPCAVMADFLLVYLKGFTPFFDLMKNSKASQADWELIVGALLLHHMRQIVSNVACQGSFVVRLDNSSPLLIEDVWSSPYHIQRGHLSMVVKIESTIFCIYPHARMSKHSCKSSCEATNTSGRFMTAFALADIRAGEEIYTSYADCKEDRRIERQSKLENLFGFSCECSKCEDLNPDEDFEKFWRVRCQNPRCRKIFVPQERILPDKKFLVMFQGWLKCTKCEAVQNTSWLQQFCSFLKNIKNDYCRMSLFKLYDTMDRILIYNNELKIDLSFALVVMSLAIHNDGTFLKNAEFKKLVSILNFLLSARAEQYSIYSIHYIVPILHLWDIIALGKYKCSKDDMKIMLQSIEIASDEFKKIFLNYYEDYIKPIII